MAWRCVTQITTAIATAGALVLGGPGDAGAADWAGASSLSAPPMRLGVNPPVAAPAMISAASAFPPPRGSRSARSCRSWRVMTDRLGETFVAARLRHTILPAACPSEPGTAAETRWSWPWDDRGLGGALPPRHVADHGPWSIRCGNAGPRERCAMVQSGLLTASGAADAEPVAPRQMAFSTHFVIDAIGAEERIIWRLYLHHRDDGRGRIVEWNAPRGTVEVRAGDTVISAPFSICTRAGCLLELDVKASAEIVNRLWDGVAVRLTISPPRSIAAFAATLSPGSSVAGQPSSYSGDITATGLRRALPNLTLLRQREMRSARDTTSTSGTASAPPRGTPPADAKLESGR